METGDPDITIAIIDWGVNEDHEDLSGNLWNNPNETPGNGIDDDINGYVDDITGWNFRSNNNTPHTTGAHGSYVAGVSSASTNNGKGIAGAAGGWNNTGCSYMNLKTKGLFGEVISAIRYATHNNAKIINMSFQFDYSVEPGPPYAGGNLGDALYQAYSAGITLVAAAGNHNLNDLPRPANYPMVISVGGLDKTFGKWTGSNYANDLDICAPAFEIWTTDGHPNNRTYTELSGTSLSSPIVAGIAGLILSHYPYYTPDEVKQIIKDNALDIENQNSNYAGLLGAGAARAGEALETIYQPLAPQNLVVSDTVNLNPKISWGANPEKDVVGYKIYRQIEYSRTNYTDFIIQDTVSDTFWIDTEFGVIGTGTVTARYYVKAIDYSEVVSNASNTVELNNGVIALFKNGQNDFNDKSNQGKVLSIFPNPFNPDVSFNFKFEERTYIKISVFNTLGQKMFSKQAFTNEHGDMRIIWDGIDDNGNEVAGGLYLYKVEVTQNKTQIYTGKIIYLK